MFTEGTNLWHQSTVWCFLDHATTVVVVVLDAADVVAADAFVAVVVVVDGARSHLTAE